MQGWKESWAYQLFQHRQHQPAALKQKQKKIKSNTYFINNNYKVQLLDFPMNDPLHLEKEREESDKVTPRWNKRRHTLAMNGVLCLWEPWKKGNILPNHHYVLFLLFEKWRRWEWIRMMKMASGNGSFIFIPVLTHRRNWRRAPFSAGLFCLCQIRSMFFLFPWS